MLYDSIYIKFQKKQTHLQWQKAALQLPEDGDSREKVCITYGTQGNSGEVGMFMTLIMVIIPQVCTFVPTYQIVYCKYVQLIVNFTSIKLYLKLAGAGKEGERTT